MTKISIAALRRFALRLWIPGKRLAVALMLVWLGVAGWIHFSGKQSQLRKVDCILVLGARSLPDGTPGPSFAGRCLHAVDLWRQDWAPYLLFTGGRGDSGTIEGEVGQNFAVSQGVPRERIAYEDQSHTTWENFLEARKLMRARGWKTCLVVTDPFHEPRAMDMAGKLGIEAYPAPTFRGPAWQDWGAWLFYLSRETLAWVKHLALNRPT